MSQKYELISFYGGGEDLCNGVEGLLRYGTKSYDFNE